MALQNTQYDSIMREYSRRQAQVQHELDERRQNAYAKIPRLTEIDREVAEISAGTARALLTGQRNSISGLRSAVKKLSDERVSLLLASHFPADYLEPHYFCTKCQDTGFIDSQKCQCFKQAEADLLYTQSNLKEILKKENFEHFSFDWYSDKIKNETTGLSAKETAKYAYDTAKAFVRDFDSRYQNLFLYGNTGVGKTFLSNCIAHELLETAHCVLYFSAYDLFEELAKTAFSSHDIKAEENPFFDCDLLIIDDLGTELTNSFVSSQLFLCINERIMRRKATIISTNLTLEEFSSVYSERIFSRVTSNYQMVKLIGNDIRIEKKFLGGK